MQQTIAIRSRHYCTLPIPHVETWDTNGSSPIEREVKVMTIIKMDVGCGGFIRIFYFSGFSFSPTQRAYEGDTTYQY